MTLEGRRLILRPLTEQDAPQLFESVHSSRDALRRRLAWARDVQSQEDSLKFIRKASEDGTKSGQMVFGIFELKSHRHLGVISLMSVQEADSRAELGYWVRSDRHDKGYATESGRLLLDHAFRKLGLHRVYARIDPANRASRKVLQKLGFRYEGCLRDEKSLNGRWVNQECWGLLKDEWKR